MDRLKLPTLDAADRQVLGQSAVFAVAFVLAVVVLAAGLGLGVRVFLMTSGLGG